MLLWPRSKVRKSASMRCWSNSAGGAILFNADKLKVNIPIRDNVLTVPLPVSQLTKPFPPAAPVPAVPGRRERIPSA